MAEIDKVKEQIGWLKISFGLLVVVDVSLIAWVAQHFATASGVLVSLSVVALLLVALVIVLINRNAQNKIDRLGDL